MRLSSLMIAMLLLGLIVTGFYSFANGLADGTAYNSNFDDSYQTSFNKIDNVTDQIDESYTKIQEEFSANDADTIGIITNQATKEPPAIIAVYLSPTIYPKPSIAELIFSLKTSFNLSATV